MYSIKIPTPCHEDWNKMTPTQQGAFCSSCQKEVVDFTKMDDHDVLNYLIAHKGSKVCGRVTYEQLNKFHLTIDEKIIYSDIRLWKKYLAILLICFSGFLVSCNNTPQKTRTIGITYSKIKPNKPVDSLPKPSATKMDTQHAEALPPLPPPAMIKGGMMMVYETVTQGNISIECVGPDKPMEIIQPAIVLPKIDSANLKKDSTKLKIDSCNTKVFS